MITCKKIREIGMPATQHEKKRQKKRSQR